MLRSAGLSLKLCDSTSHSAYSTSFFVWRGLRPSSADTSAGKNKFRSYRPQKQEKLHLVILIASACAWSSLYFHTNDLSSLARSPQICKSAASRTQRDRLLVHAVSRSLASFPVLRLADLGFYSFRASCCPKTFCRLLSDPLVLSICRASSLIVRRKDLLPRHEDGCEHFRRLEAYRHSGKRHLQLLLVGPREKATCRHAFDVLVMR